jgi:hypothetical protein
LGSDWFMMCSAEPSLDCGIGNAKFATRNSNSDIAHA